MIHQKIHGPLYIIQPKELKNNNSYKKKYVNTEILLFEFEWYLRDYFFRINNSNGREFKRLFDSDEVCHFIKENYLKYRNWNMKEITELFSSVISNLIIGIF